MASISKQPGGRRTIQFVAGDGKRRSVRLGRMDQRTAEAIRTRVEALVMSSVAGTPWDGELARWVAQLGEPLRGRLVAVGLVPVPEERAVVRLGGFLGTYVAARTDVKLTTRRNLKDTAARLVEFFGADKDLRAITPGDADAWLLWLRERVAKATAGRAAARAKQFFKAAFRRKLIAENPFADVKALSMVNEARKFFVPRDVISRGFEACPDAEWRLIVALSRYGGLRCPSEHYALVWADVDWERGRIRVPSPKTARHEGKAERLIPLFPELRPYLEEAFDQTPEGTEYVIHRHRLRGQNLRTQLLRVLRRAGVAPWPKPFHNLRASRETELLAAFPVHVVCAWLGHDALVAQRHYAMVTDDHFTRATSVQAVHQAVHQAVQPAAVPSGQGELAQHAKPGIQAESPLLTPICHSGQSVQAELSMGRTHERPY
jgi:integrase